MKDLLDRPALLVAVAVSVSLCLWALGWALEHVILAVGAVLPAVGTLLGNVLAGVVHGTVSGAVGSLANSVGLVSATTVTVVVAVTAVWNVAEKAASKPFYPTVAILSVLQTFLLDLSKEFWPAEPISKFFFKASSALLFAVSAALWATGKWPSRLGGAVLYLVMPTLLVVRAIQPYKELPLAQLVGMVDSGVWSSAVGFVMFALMAVVFAKVMKH